ncbi:gem-associated protein 8-like [Symphalangus syndactylus]|uniref:gem-associated protein 8-like n=1 Tax=Symphalangus syndactylus TaxID=9590 RepID=UPI003004938E
MAEAGGRRPWRRWAELWPAASARDPRFHTINPRDRERRYQPGSRRPQRGWGGGADRRYQPPRRGLLLADVGWWAGPRVGGGKQQDSPCSSSHFRGSGQHPHSSSRIQASTREDQALSKEEEMETESDAEVACDLSNMEITEELRQYFAETEGHRELRWRQQLDAERLDSYVNADHDLYCNTRGSVGAPTERPAERRQAEMKRLYWDSAAKIQAMEAMVQLSFDKHCDPKQPNYWPVIHLTF